MTQSHRIGEGIGQEKNSILNFVDATPDKFYQAISNHKSTYNQIRISPNLSYKNFVLLNISAR